MTRVLWPLMLCVLVVLVVGCGKSESGLTVIDVQPGQRVQVDPAVRNPVVKVTAPSVVYVDQSERFRVLIEWPHKRSGQVPLPLSLVNDGSGRPMFVSMFLLSGGGATRVAPAVAEPPSAPARCIECDGARCCGAN